jgi:hypothetical protein
MEISNTAEQVHVGDSVSAPLTIFTMQETYRFKLEQISLSSKTAFAALHDGCKCTLLMPCILASQITIHTLPTTMQSGEMTFSKQFGFLESGEDMDNILLHTTSAMDWNKTAFRSEMKESLNTTEPSIGKLEWY